MTNKSIGQFIAALRKANGMTQQDVADRLNVSNKAVSRWERGECAPDLSLLPALAEMFGVTCDELLKGERILDSSPNPKSEPKVEKQIKAIVNRAISNFKTMTCVSLALSAMGLVFMFGISYGFYRPIIGFAVAFLFAVAAVVVEVVAINRIKETKTDNELFEDIDGSLQEKFNKNLGEHSFWAFFAVLSVLLLSAPLVIFFNPQFVNYVLDFEDYVTCCLWVIVALLVAVYFISKERYVAWITDQSYVKASSRIDRKIRQMTLLQIGMVILAATAFFVSWYFEISINEKIPWQTVVLEYLGGFLLAGNIACFIVFMIKEENDKKQLILPGIRNILFIVSAICIGCVHSTGFMYDETQTGNTIRQRYDYWQTEYWAYSIVFATAVIIVFKVIDTLIRKNKK